MRLSFSPTIAAFAFFACVAPVPALADGPLSVYVGPQFITQGAARDLAGNTQIDVGAGYDFGPRTIVPIRATFQVDDAFGSSGGSGLNVFGVGVAARLTTPLYVGVGVTLYNVNAHGIFAPVPGSGTSLSGGSASSSSVFGAGTTLFVGSKLFSLPGIGLAIEGSYKAIPSVDGFNPSAYGVGLRASL